MRKILGAALLGLAFGGAAVAQSPPLVRGKVEKVDAAAGKVTIDHEKVPNLDMDPMTMVWAAKDPSMLKGLKAGDKVRFTAERVEGRLTVTMIQKGR